MAHILGIVLAALASLTGACASETGSRAVTPPADAVVLMTFNVENLFDTRDDPGKDDATFLPLAAKQTPAHRARCNEIEVAHWRDQCLNWDWNEAVLERKLEVLAAAILAVGDGRGPDVLALQEVENIAVLERLRTQYLTDAGYQPAILVEGNDARGIDVAFISRLEVVGTPRLHTIPFQGFGDERIADTRGILETTFRLPDGELLTGFAVHFPAPFHPYRMRQQAYRFLANLRAALPSGHAAFAAGDFNTPAREEAEHRLLQPVREDWVIVHELGCGECQGSHYYAREDSWSFLDMILWARPTPGAGAAVAGWAPDSQSVRLGNSTHAQRDRHGRPAAFRLPDASGVSDHWPLTVTLRR